MPQLSNETQNYIEREMTYSEGVQEETGETAHVYKQSKLAFKLGSTDITCTSSQTSLDPYHQKLSGKEVVFLDNAQDNDIDNDELTARNLRNLLHDQ